MLDIVLRYYPIVKKINSLQDKNVLEIGSDDYGIAPFLRGKKITLLDTNFRRKSMKKVKYVKGSVLDLPFKKDSFDIVVSVDMLEHIPPKLRDKAVSELMRVSKRYVFLAFPADELAERRDKKLITILTPLKNQPFTKYINEHIQNGVPRSNQVVKQVKEKGAKNVEILSNLNIKLELPLVILSNLDFIPILVVQKILDKYKVDILPNSFKIFMGVFGWVSPILSFGDCYRKILVIDKSAK